MKNIYLIEINENGNPYIEIYTDDGEYHYYESYNNDELLLDVLKECPEAKLSKSGKSISIKKSGKSTERSRNKPNAILMRAMQIGGFKK